MTVRPSSASSSGGRSSDTMPPRRSTCTATGSAGDSWTTAASAICGLSSFNTRLPPTERRRSSGSKPLSAAVEPEATDATVRRASVRKMPTAPCPSGGSTRTSGMRSPTSRPRRSTVHAVSAPRRRLMATSRSDELTMRLSSAVRMRPPTSTPACSAGEPGATSSTVTSVTGTGCGVMKTTVSRSTGSTAFIAEPAPSMNSRCQALLPAKLAGAVGSSSPSIRTNPPKGRKLSE